MNRRFIPLFTAVLVCFASAAHALSLLNIRTAVRRNVRDTATSATLQRYSDSVLTDIINEAQRDIVVNTWIIQKSTSVTVTSDVTAALPTDMIQIYRVTASGANLPEINFQQQDADQDNATWSATTGTVQYFLRDYTRTSGSTNLQATITIVPAQSGSITVKVYYYALATDLSADADIPFNSISWFNAYDDLLVWYATYRLMYIEGMWDKAKVFKDQYDTRLQILYEDYGVKPERNPAVPVKEQKP